MDERTDAELTSEYGQDWRALHGIEFVRITQSEWPIYRCSFCSTEGWESTHWGLGFVCQHIHSRRHRSALAWAGIPDGPRPPPDDPLPPPRASPTGPTSQQAHGPRGSDEPPSLAQCLAGEQKCPPYPYDNNEEKEFSRARYNQFLAELTIDEFWNLMEAGPPWPDGQLPVTHDQFLARLVQEDFRPWHDRTGWQLVTKDQLLRILPDGYNANSVWDDLPKATTCDLDDFWKLYKSRCDSQTLSERH